MDAGYINCDIVPSILVIIVKMRTNSINSFPLDKINAAVINELNRTENREKRIVEIYYEQYGMIN